MAALGASPTGDVGSSASARSGLAAAGRCAHAGAACSPGTTIGAALARARRCRVGVRQDADCAGSALLVLSPAFRMTHPAAAPVGRDGPRGRRPDRLRHRPVRRPQSRSRTIVGITGTNGKSTTTALIGPSCGAAGRDARRRQYRPGRARARDRAAGADLCARDVVLSARSVQRLRPDVAVLLNITPDHLDRHGGMDGYVAAKSADLPPPGRRRHGRHRRRRRAQPSLWAQLAGTRAACPFGRDAPSRAACSPPGPARGRARGCGDRGCRSGLAGRCPAVTTIRMPPRLRRRADAGPPPEEAARGLASFPGCRTEWRRWRAVGAVICVNDCKATNPDAATKASVQFRSIYWIAGGRPKAGGFASLRSPLGRSPPSVLIGEAAEEIAAEVGDLVPTSQVGTLRPPSRPRAARHGDGARGRWCCCRPPAPPSTSSAASRPAATCSASWLGSCRGAAA